jgi:tRNA threonylcarbamoyladenosine biosynthesis protein TsaB
MKTIAIDTATEVCGIGLLLENGNWFDYSRKAGLNHAEFVSIGVRRILKDAGVNLSDLDLIVCSRGPGSFTGLRIGMATAKGLAAGADLPMVSVPTLDAMAFGLEWTSKTVVPVLDGKKNRVYTAAYKGGEKIQGPFDLDLHKLPAFLSNLGKVLLTGPGVDIAAAERPGGVSLDRRTVSLNRAYTELGIRRFERFGPDEPDAGPDYLRKSDAELMLDG